MELNILTFPFLLKFSDVTTQESWYIWELLKSCACQVHRPKVNLGLEGNSLSLLSGRIFGQQKLWNLPCWLFKAGRACSGDGLYQGPWTKCAIQALYRPCILLRPYTTKDLLLDFLHDLNVVTSVPTHLPLIPLTTSRWPPCDPWTKKTLLPS